MSKFSNGEPVSSDPHLREELRATLEAYKELGPEYQEQVMDSFLERMDDSFGARSRRDDGPRRAAHGRHGSLRTLAIGAAIVVAWSMLARASFGHPRYALVHSWGDGRGENPPSMVVDCPGYGMLPPGVTSCPTLPAAPAAPVAPVAPAAPQPPQPPAPPSFP